MALSSLPEVRRTSPAKLNKKGLLLNSIKCPAKRSKMSGEDKKNFVYTALSLVTLLLHYVYHYLNANFENIVNIPWKTS